METKTVGRAKSQPQQKLPTKTYELTFDGHEAHLKCDAATAAQIYTTLSYVNWSIYFEYDKKGFSKEKCRQLALCHLAERTPDGVRFPTGMAERVERVLKSKGIKTVLNTAVKFPELVEYDLEEFLESLKLDVVDHQLDCIEAFLESPQGQLIAPTGSGKTLCCALFVKHFPKANILVVVPRANIQDQMIDTLKFILKEPIGKLGGSGKNRMERVTVAVSNSAAKSKLLANTEVLVFDELHLDYKKQVQISKKCRKALVRVGMTATPKRKDGCEFVSEGVVGPRIFEIDRTHLEKEGFILCPSFVYVHYEHQDTRQINFGHGSYQPGFGYKYYNGSKYVDPNDTNHYKYTCLNNEARNKILVDIFDAFLSWKKRTGPGVIFTGLVDHAYLLQDMLAQRNRKMYVVECKTKTKVRDEMFEEARRSSAGLIANIQDAPGIVDGLIAADILNAGVDIRPLQFALMAEVSQNESITVQRIGRVLRAPRGQEIKSKAVVAMMADQEYWYFTKRSERIRNFLEEEFPNSTHTSTSPAKLIRHFRKP